MKQRGTPAEDLSARGTGVADIGGALRILFGRACEPAAAECAEEKGVAGANDAAGTDGRKMAFNEAYITECPCQTGQDHCEKLSCCQRD